MEKIMNVLITGSRGFIGNNLVKRLSNYEMINVMEYDVDDCEALLDEYCKKADFVMHLAGINRPKREQDYAGNLKITEILLKYLSLNNNFCPILFSSSIQATLNNAYGKSKKLAEDLLIKYQKNTGASVMIYRLPNVFGKWCRPNYNSVVATFCHNIGRDLPIQVDNEKTIINLAYVNDVVDEFIAVLKSKKLDQIYCDVGKTYTITLGGMRELLYSFKNDRIKNILPDLSNELTAKLYSTYLSYIPSDDLINSLNMKFDARGSFTEFVKSEIGGQVSVNVCKKQIVKGNHWHMHKNEKFLVIKGKGIIQLRNMVSTEVLKYEVSEDEMRVIDIPPGYIHNIENVGDSDMIFIIWANEIFDPNNSDTFYHEV